MEIQTFEAFSMKDAVKSVKKSLGSDAVILSTKEKLSPNGKGTIFEVTAASAIKSKRITGAQQSNTQADLGQIENLLHGLSVRLTAMQDQIAVKRQVSILEGGISDLKLLLLENLRTKDGSAFRDLPQPLVPIQRQLALMGVDEGAIASLVKHLRDFDVSEHTPVDSLVEFYKDNAIRWMMKRIRIAPRWSFSAGNPAVHILIGSNGSGKTSVVSKLASFYHSRERNKVAVISYDIDRLAASEQMRVFCKVIGVPFASVSSADEFNGFLNSFSDCELILVDTSGRSAKRSDAVTDLGQLKEASVTASFHLCLAVTEKESQMDLAVRSFSQLGLSSLVFSRLDESVGFGEIFNISRRWGVPLSFFSVGQNVPEDLERATRERVVERVFGL